MASAAEPPFNFLCDAPLESGDAPCHSCHSNDDGDDNMDDGSFQPPRLDVVAVEVIRKRGGSSPYYPRVSNAGGCPRALAYKLRGIEESDPHSDRSLSTFADGHLHEDATINLLSETEYEITDAQLGLNVAEIPGVIGEPRHCSECNKEIPYNVLHGHIDGLLHTDEATYLFEHKALGDFAYNNLTSEFPEGYITQCCCYLKGLKNLGMEIDQALLLCKSKNTGEYRQIHIKYNHDADVAVATNCWNNQQMAFDYVVQKNVDLHSKVEAHGDIFSNMPDRPYDYDHWKCRFCTYRSECWSNFPDEVSDFEKAVDLPDTDPLYGKLWAFKKAREDKKEAEAREKKYRSDVASELTERSFKSGVVGDLRFSISAFEFDSVNKDLIPEESLANATQKLIRQTIRITEK